MLRDESCGATHPGHEDCFRRLGLRGLRKHDRWGYGMPKFLIEASLTTQGVKGLQSEGGSSRREAVSKAVESLGGSLESFYFAFGKSDVLVVADMPDNESAAAMALSVNASGAVSTRTVVLLTPEEVDSAASRSVEYRPPGG